MIYSDPQDLPTDHKPEHLIVISEEIFGKAMQSYAQGEFLLDPNIHYLVKPNNHEANSHPITKALLKQGHLKENTILLLEKDSGASAICLMTCSLKKPYTFRCKVLWNCVSFLEQKVSTVSPTPKISKIHH